MPLDPSIILDVNQNPGIQPQQLVSMFDLARQAQQYRQQQAGQNALKTIFSNPDSVDPQTGMLTQQAIRGVMAADPEAGMKLQDMSLDQQVKHAQLVHSQTEAGTAKFGFMAKVAGSGYDAYQSAKDSGKSEEDAIAAGQSARNTAAKDGGGIVGDDVIDGITGSPFEPNGARALASTDKEWANLQHQQRADKTAADRADTADKRADAQANREDAMIAQGNRRIDDAESRTDNSKWEVLTDPARKGDDGKDIPATQYRYNPTTGQSTTLDASQPYKPAGAQKMGSGGGAGGAAFNAQESDLMGALAERGVSLPAGMRSRDQQKALYSGILERNPGKSPDEIADLIKKGQIEFGAQKKETGVAATQAGKVELAQNEIKRFSPLALDASKAVPRGNFMPINKLMQTADTALSDPDLKTLKIYVNSIMNAYDQLAARGGTDAAKREEARGLLTSADSPEAFEKAIQAFGKEADAAHGAAVDAMKVPELEGGTSGKPKATAAQVATPASKADYDALPSGARYSKPGDAPGTYRVKP